MYIVQVLNGLAYLHEKSIIHRDVKGGNLLLTKEGTIKLADFGIALQLNETKPVTQDNEDDMGAYGSPYWMAPEVIKLSSCTQASDIWSLGCTILELITGSPPYFELGIHAAMYRIVQDANPPIPDDISDKLKDFLANCFKKNPEERLSARQLLSHPWLIQMSANKLLTSRGMRRSLRLYNTANNERKKSLTQVAELNSELGRCVDCENKVKKECEYHRCRSCCKKLGKNCKGHMFFSPGSLDITEVPVKKEKNKLLPPNPKGFEPRKSEPILRIDTDMFRVSASSIPVEHSSNIATPIYSASLDSASILRKQSEPNLYKTELSPKSEIPAELISAKENGKDYKINIVTTETRQDQKNMFTVYKIEVTVGSRMWVIYRRFRDFRDLHTRLKQTSIKDKLPDLPHRKMFGSSLDPLFVEQRRVKLQKYVEDLLSLSDAITKSYPFLSFFKTQHKYSGSL